MLDGDKLAVFHAGKGNAELAERIAELLNTEMMRHGITAHPQPVTPPADNGGKYVAIRDNVYQATNTDEDRHIGWFAYGASQIAATLNAETATLRSEIARLQRELEATRERIAELKGEWDEYTAHRELLEATLTSCKKLYDSKCDRLDEVQKELQALVNKSAQDKRDLRDLGERLQGSEDVSNSLRSELAAARERVAELEGAINRTHAKIKEARDLQFEQKYSSADSSMKNAQVILDHYITD